MPPIRRVHRTKVGTVNSEVDSTLGIKRGLKRTISYAPFLVLNASLLIFLLWDVVNKGCATGKWLLPSYTRTAVCSEWLCLALSILNTFSSLFMALWPRLKIEFIKLTPRQIELLGMLDFSKCFSVQNPPPLKTAKPSPGHGKPRTPSFNLSDLDWLFKVKNSSGGGPKRRSQFGSPSSASDSQISNYGSLSSRLKSLENQSFTSPYNSSQNYSPGQSPASFYLPSTSSISTPRSYTSPTSSAGSTPKDLPINRSISFYRPDLMDPVQAKHRESLARLRRAKSSSPFTSKKHIRSTEQLRKYLEDFEEEKENQLSPAGAPIYGNGNGGHRQEFNSWNNSHSRDQMFHYELAPLLSDESVGSFATSPLSQRNEDGTGRADSPNEWLNSLLSRSLSVEPLSTSKTASSPSILQGISSRSAKRRSDAGQSDRTSLSGIQESEVNSDDIKTYLLWEKSHFEDAGGKNRRSKPSQVSGNASFHKEEGCKLILQPIMPAHWVQYDLDSNDLDLYTQNLRSWISKTVLKPLVKEIDSLNQIFENQARPDLRLGEASLASLQHVLLSRNYEQLPTLHRLLPYLEIHSNQQYVVQRLRDLAKDGILQNFKAHSGGSELISGSSGKTKPWDSHLPTDVDLLWHILSTYLDAQLPPDPLCPDGKSFSAKYLLKSPSEPSKIQKAPHAYYIWHSSKSPASFRLVHGMDNAPKTADGQSLKLGIDLGNGKNSFFQSILLFLAFAKTEEDGTLGQISLGESGLNLLWVLDQ